MTELSYKSIRDQADYYRERFGIAIEDSGIPFGDLVELRAIRNILIHNNGIINHIFLEQVKSLSILSVVLSL